MFAQRWSNVDKQPIKMLTQSWRDVPQPTEKNLLFLLANLGVSTTRVQRWPEVPQPTFVICAILYVGPTLAQR